MIKSNSITSVNLCDHLSETLRIIEGACVLIANEADADEHITSTANHCAALARDARPVTGQLFKQLASAAAPKTTQIAEHETSDERQGDAERQNEACLALEGVRDTLRILQNEDGCHKQHAIFKMLEDNIERASHLVASIALP